MSEHNTRIGIDRRGDLFYVARVDHGSGRQEVKALLRLEQHHVGDHHLLQGGQSVLSLADENVLVKRLPIGGSDDLMVRFELAQALPEQQTEYWFDSISSGIEGQVIGLIVRRDRLREYVDTTLGDHAAGFSDARYQMRAVALAAGYLNFCRRAGGEPVCLADFTRTSVSLAFTYQGMVVDVCHLPLGKFNPDSEEDNIRMAMEMKTLVNFRGAALFSEGITTPLSSLVVSGENVTNNMIGNIQKMFTIDISRPAINTGFFSSEADLTGVPLENYIVALGLAAN